MKTRWTNSVALSLVGALCLSSTVQAASMVCFEAESTRQVTAPMRLVDTASPPANAKTAPVAGASGGKYLEVPEGAGKPPDVHGDALFRFEIHAPGTYFLWCRVWWPDGCGNSFSMSIDDAATFTFGEDATYKSWHWVKAPLKLKQLDLTQGTHALRISNREDGALLDQILFVKEKRYVPVDIEAVTQPAAEPVN